MRRIALALASLLCACQGQSSRSTTTPCAPAPIYKSDTISALVTLHMAIGLDPSTLRLHKDDPKTTHTYCPGSRVSKADIMNAVQHALSVDSAGAHLQDRPPNV